MPPQICSLVRNQLPEVIIPAACSCSSFRIDTSFPPYGAWDNHFWSGFLWSSSGPALGCLGDGLTQRGTAAQLLAAVPRPLGRHGRSGYAIGKQRTYMDKQVQGKRRRCPAERCSRSRNGA
eukprot:gene12732-biopygen4962